MGINLYYYYNYF